MTDEAASPLRRRTIEHMTSRDFLFPLRYDMLEVKLKMGATTKCWIGSLAINAAGRPLRRRRQ
jgi:hypothetical protein